MFSKYLSQEKLGQLLIATPPSFRKAESILQKQSLDLTDISQLILGSLENEPIRQSIIQKAILQRQKYWQSRVFLMPPLYVSDGDPVRGGCLDHCLYCPWRHNNVSMDKLMRLTDIDVSEECKYLVGLGYGDVEMVAATDAKLLKSKSVVKMIQAAKLAGMKNVGINFFPLRRVDDYQHIADAGCDFVIVWQETYQTKAYQLFHPRGPKANMKKRLDAHDRALRGGIKTVGVAFLGGLSDWRFDTLATIWHAQYLHDEYGANIIFGMPRWKNGPDIPMRVALELYSDAAYELVGALYSLAQPEALPWLSTREHFDLSAQCAQGGGCLFTLDCSTAVGGYTRDGGSAQFPVYTRSIEEGVVWLSRQGLVAHNHLPW